MTDIVCSNCNNKFVILVEVDIIHCVKCGSQWKPTSE